MADRINNINFTLSLRGMKGLGNSIAILLCGLFLYNSMGYIFVNSAIRSNLKKQVFAEICKLPDEFLVPITLHNTDKGKLIIEKNRIEIKLNGRMFDVVKMKASADSITYYCVRDIKEEQLIRKMSLLNQRHETNRPVRKSTGQLIDHLIKIALVQQQNQLTGYALTITHHIMEIPDYLSPTIHITVPPPQFLS